MELENIYRYYVPSLAAASAFTIIFILLTVMHSVLIARTRRFFTFAIVMGGIFELVGHGARAYSHSHLDMRLPYIIQMLLILLAPIWFAAAIYMLLGRVLVASGYSDLSIVRPTWITRVFVLGDILCFLVQVAGASKLIPRNATPHDLKIGENIILAGLTLQILIFVFFLVITAVFHIRYRRQLFRVNEKVLEQHLWSLYVTSLFVSVRNVFRLVEYRMGIDGYLFRNEWPIYAFDVSLMAVIMVIAMSWYRGSLKKPLIDFRESIAMTPLGNENNDSEPTTVHRNLDAWHEIKNPLLH